MDLTLDNDTTAWPLANNSSSKEYMPYLASYLAPCAQLMPNLVLAGIWYDNTVLMRKGKKGSVSF